MIKLKKLRFCKITKIFLCVYVLFLVGLSACSAANKTVKIGVSFGVGAATRWGQEEIYMKERAEEQGVQIEVRLNKTDTPKTQKQDCFEMIDSGIDVLVLTARDVNNCKEILDYAKEKKVPVISYARIIMGDPVDLYVGYDSSRIGQRQGQYLTELVPRGEYILLRGDPGDYNSQLVYDGAWRYIEPIENDINIFLDTSIPGWSVEECKKTVMEAVSANGNKVDAILAPNDKLAGACIDALAELGVKSPVVVTGMDAELDAAQRIAAGTQGCTFYMDLRFLANAAIDDAIHLAKGEKTGVNAEFDNKSGDPVDANLITGQLVIQENLDKVLIDGGVFTHEEVYGS